MKSLFRRHIPSAESLKSHKQLHWLGKHLHQSGLWHFNRTTISKAFAIGLFCAFLPIPFQMLVAAPLAVIFVANLPISVALVWITNPLTMPAIFYGCYHLGAWILGVSIQQEFVMSFTHLQQVFGTIWQPFLLGCLLVSTATSVLGYVGIQLAYRYKIYRRSKRI